MPSGHTLLVGLTAQPKWNCTVSTWVYTLNVFFFLIKKNAYISGVLKTGMLAEPDLRGLLGPALHSEGVRPDDDGEPQQWAGAVVHGQVMSDHLQVHYVFPGAGERLGEHQHGANVGRTLQ